MLNRVRTRTEHIEPEPFVHVRVRQVRAHDPRTRT